METEQTMSQALRGQGTDPTYKEWKLVLLYADKLMRTRHGSYLQGMETSGLGCVCVGQCMLHGSYLQGMETNSPADFSCR